MRSAVKPALVTIVWSLVVYLLVAWQSIRAEGLFGDGPDAADALALALMVVAASTVVLLVVSLWVRASGLITVQWALCGLSIVVGLILLVATFAA